MTKVLPFSVSIARLMCCWSVNSHKISNPFFFTVHAHGDMSDRGGHCCCIWNTNKKTPLKKHPLYSCMKFILKSLYLVLGWWSKIFKGNLCMSFQSSGPYTSNLQPPTHIRRFRALHKTEFFVTYYLMLRYWSFELLSRFNRY